MTNSSTDAVVFRHSRAKNSLLAAVCLSLASASLVVILGWVDLGPDQSEMLSFAWPILLFLTPVGLYGLYGVQRSREETLRLSRDGIFDRRSLTAPVKWDAFKSARMVKGRSSYIFLERNPSSNPLPLNGISRLALGVNRWLGMDGLHISMTGLDGSLDDLVRAIGYFAPQLDPTRSSQ